MIKTKAIARALAVAGLMLVLFGAMTVSAFAETQSVSYVDAKGDPMGPEKCTIVTAGMSELKAGWYAVRGNIEISGRVNIAAGASVDLILCDGATITLPRGIHVPKGTKLTIYGQTGGSGKLVARNGTSFDDTNDAAIGSNFSERDINGDITIRGGKIEAVTRGLGAAIGGGYSCAGTVYIDGGEVTATTHGRSAAIGSGQLMGNAYVVITGGKVNAVSNNSQGCAIGGPSKSSILYKSNTSITIKGGEVNATANSGVAIGSGDGTQGGTITISGGTVNATSAGVAAIGYPGVMKTLLTHEEGRPLTRVRSTGYSGKLTLGVPFYDGSGVLQPGDTTNDQVAGKTLVAHTAHEPGTYHAPTDPSYNPSTRKYTNGNKAYYECELCHASLIKKGDQYQEAKPLEYLIPYFEYEWHNANMLTAYNGKDADIVVPDRIPADYPDESMQGKMVEKIGLDTFRNNKTLRTVKAETIGTVGENAFRGCSNLTDAVFGQNLYGIGVGAFYDCPKLTRLEIRRDGPIFLGDLPHPYDGISDVVQYNSDVVIYGYHDSVLHQKTNWGIPFYGIDGHSMSSTWKWTGPDADTGQYEGTAIFQCSECSLRGEVTATSTVTKQATCTSKGEASYTARFSNEAAHSQEQATAKKEIAALGHEPKDSFVEKNIVKATCTEPGSYDRVTVCKRCNAELAKTTVTTPATGHDWSDWATTRPATCASQGEEARTCKNNATHKETRSIDRLEHTWGEWTVQTSPTESTKGYESHQCTQCKVTEGREIPRTTHVHRVSKVNAIAPTCIEKGNIEYYVCDVKEAQGDASCGRRFVEDPEGTVTIEYNGSTITAREVLREETIIPLTDHTWNSGTVTREPACTMDGVKTFTCTVCGKNRTEAIEKTLHDTEDVTETIREASCDHSGYHWKVRRCKTCAETMTRQLIKDDMIDHTWGEWTVTTPATETKAGEETRTCSRCNGTETRPIPVTTHVHHLSKIDAKAATCTEAGNIECYVCDQGSSPCGRYFRDANGTTEIDRKDVAITADHKWDNGTETVSPTCTSDGVKTFTCTVCGETKEEAIGKIPHDIETVKEIIWELTDEEPGYYWNIRQCKVCGEIISRELVKEEALQMGEDGTPCGRGASAYTADKAIREVTGEKDPAGAAFQPLDAKSVKQTETSATLTWTPVDGAAEYVIYGNACGNGNAMQRLVTTGKNSYKITEVDAGKISKGTYYKLIVVALDKDGNVISTSKVVYVATKGGKYGNIKKLTIKAKINAKGKKTKKYRTLKSTVLKKGKKLKIKVTATPVSKKLKARNYRKISYVTSKASVATVSSKGVIKAKKKGTCYITAYAQNGVKKSVKIRVR